MMSVSEYALDVSKTPEEILKLAISLGFDVKDVDDLLDDYMITELDSAISSGNNLEEVIEEEIALFEENISKEENVKEKYKTNNSNKKKNISSNKKDLANRKKEMYKNKTKLQSNTTKQDNIVLYSEGMTIGDFAKELNVSPAEVIKKLFMLGVMSNINNTISLENAELICLDYNKELKRKEKADVTNFEEYEVIDNPEDLVSRPPVVTIMGHVDHGKTTLLDTIRKTNVVSTEAGGITQAISAYQVIYNDSPITFIDTPGHAAFTEMRARGAQITDIVIIIVAADDGVMPQTMEAVDHAKAAGVPIIVAINKMDKPGANPERIMADLSEMGLTPEEWGGDTLYNKIVAQTGEGINELLENILLVASMQELKANPKRYAMGTVVEARLDKHLGPVTTILI